METLLVRRSSTSTLRRHDDASCQNLGKPISQLMLDPQQREYTGLRTTIVKFHKAMGFSSLFNALSNFSENDSFLYTQVCEILIYPTGTENDC